MRRWWIALGLVLGLAVLIGAGIAWKVRVDRQARELLEEARQEIALGRFARARTALQDLLNRRPGWDEALYELGVCELARGKISLALDAWAKIPEDSPQMGWVEVRRSVLAMNQGRWSECEDLLRSADARPGPHKAEARWGLVLLLRQQGRRSEAKRWLEDGFDVMTDPIETLGRLYKLDNDPYPIEGVRIALNRATKQSPDDDRVWLGQANLAMRLGQYDEARALLDRCAERRPNDVPVWRMKLDWAIAADRPEEAREALVHLPADQEPADRVSFLRAWFARYRGDTSAEQAALKDRLAINPADAEALERLAELELAASHPESAEKLRRRKADLDLVQKEYVKRLARAGSDQFSKLAELGVQLGRTFDAARWRQLAGQPAGKSSESSEAGNTVPIQPGATLANLVPEAAGDRLNVARTAAKPQSAPLAFTDDAQAAGLIFTQDNGRPADRLMLIPPVTSSGGVGLIDFDNDGWLDVYAVQGGPFPPDPGSSQPGDRLFRNRGDGTFEDVTERSGIAAMPRGYGHGIAVADYDNDGRADLFITRWRSYALYWNRGDGTFEDRTAAVGLDGDRDWPTSAAFADLDSDGDLDLYVCHYLRWDENDKRTCSDPNDPAVYHCSPVDFPALSDHIFRNDSGRFTDVTREAGLNDTDGRGLGVLAADVDDDGKVELFVANDMSANYLLKNQGGISVEEIGLAAGVASNAYGGYQAGMGVACGDVDGDGKPDLAVTNFFNESTTLFRNLGQGFFADHSAAIGLAASSRYVLGFGIAMLDADRDGWLDVMTANGHVFDGRPQFPWKMPVQLYRNNGGANPKLSEVSAQAGAAFQVERMGRGLAAGDLDNDGRIDALVISQNEPMAYFHNRTEGGHFLTLRLEGTKSNRDSVGACVTVRAGGRARIGQRIGGGSYQSASDPRLHFGLGDSTEVDEVEVRWPSGAVDRHAGLAADRAYHLREGEPTAVPLPGWNGSR